MSKLARESGSIIFENDPIDGIHHEVVIDGNLVYEGYDIDELIVRLFRVPEPNGDRQGPGF
ncbi:hypothetical protein [Rhizobium sp. BG4]|uniref:hypothetical protein n=1 Tax=Rhizobium sp. BG4 TaxID=2613770 RepID=UPI00193CF871|nr:hypothetical protein [Rhizobium sp. BG4]QRM45772.1 hypothetical protein F2982_20305 [Rhizobium sp. BG4]